MTVTYKKQRCYPIPQRILINSLKKIFIILMILALAFTFSFALYKDVISVIFLATAAVILLIMMPSLVMIRKKDVIVLVLIGTILLASLLNMSSFRLGSFMYMILYILYYYCFIKLLDSNVFSINSYIKLIKTIVVTYFFVLIIQQVMAIIGFEFVFNHIASEPEKFRLNSLATEPSYAARILVVAMISLMTVRGIEKGRNFRYSDMFFDKFIWLLFLYQILTLCSGFGYMLLIILMLKFSRLKTGAITFAALTLLIYAGIEMEIEALIRVKGTFIAFFTFDPKEIIAADPSASLRILPTMAYIQDFASDSAKIWLGYGIDYARSYIPTVVPFIPEDSFQGGVMPVFMFDMGLINTLLMIYMVAKNALIKLVSIDTLILIICVGAAPFSSQLFWFCMIMYTVNKYFVKKYNLLESKSHNETVRFRWRPKSMLRMRGLRTDLPHFIHSNGCKP